MASQVAVYEFRANRDLYEVEYLKEMLKKIAKKWCFQIERGDTGYEHFQGRMSLIKKRRKTELMKLMTGLDMAVPNFLEPTISAEHKKEAFYCLKEDTRIEGPYSDNDKITYIPRQYRGIMEKLRPFQKHIWDNRNKFDDRTINVIYCPNGGKGKSAIASLCELYGNGIDLPPVNDAKELVQVMCDICMAKNTRNPSPVFIDMPRAMSKNQLYGMYTAIEQIKKGKLYDMRYHYKEWWIDSPQIWVFSNDYPNINLLSTDRWVVWQITELFTFVKLKIQPPQPIVHQHFGFNRSSDINNQN